MDVFSSNYSKWIGGGTKCWCMLILKIGEHGEACPASWAYQLCLMDEHVLHSGSTYKHGLQTCQHGPCFRSLFFVSLFHATITATTMSTNVLEMIAVPLVLTCAISFVWELLKQFINHCFPRIDPHDEYNTKTTFL